ncbi:hypothetical protein X777_12603, partial [Ooceraea biroi]
WWDDECTSELRKKRSLYHSFKLHPNIENQGRYISACREFSNFVKKKRRRAFRAFCESLSFSSDTTNAWNTVRSFSRNNQCKRDEGNNNYTDRDKFYSAFDKIAPTNPIPSCTSTSWFSGGCSVSSLAWAPSRVVAPVYF